MYDHSRWKTVSKMCPVIVLSGLCSLPLWALNFEVVILLKSNWQNFLIPRFSPKSAFFFSVCLKSTISFSSLNISYKILPEYGTFTCRPFLRGHCWVSPRDWETTVLVNPPKPELMANLMKRQAAGKGRAADEVELSLADFFWHLPSFCEYFPGKREAGNGLISATQAFSAVLGSPENTVLLKTLPKRPVLYQMRNPPKPIGLTGTT